MIALVGPFAPSLAGSELAKLRGELSAGLPPFDLAAARAAIELVRDAVASGQIASAHDISEGGLACCVAECAIWGGVGAVLDLEPLIRRAEVDEIAALFGEGPVGFIVSGPRETLMELSKRAGAAAFVGLGTVGGDSLQISSGGATLKVSIGDARSVFDAMSSIPSALPACGGPNPIAMVLGMSAAYLESGDRSMTSHGSPTSACTRCSIVVRSRPASPLSTADT
jgi:phosphoribosylformylglycinamidine synthase